MILQKLLIDYVTSKLEARMISRFQSDLYPEILLMVDMLNNS